MAWIKDKVIELKTKYLSDDPFELASLMNVRVVPWNLHEEVQGVYKYIRRNKYIFINNNLTENKQRIVCAHELGHAVLHPRSNTPFLRSSTLFSVDKIEVEANTFAAELLIPDEIINKYRYTNVTIQEVAASYGVPEEFAYFKTFRKGEV